MLPRKRVVCRGHSSKPASMALREAGAARGDLHLYSHLSGFAITSVRSAAASYPCLPDPRSGSVAFPKMRPSSRKVMAREPRPMTKDFRALANVTGQAKTWRGYALLPGAVAGQPSPSPREPSPGIRASLLTQAKFFQHERSCRSPRGDTQSPRLSTILVSTFYPPGHRYG
jgi:hypothetical protein